MLAAFANPVFTFMVPKQEKRRAGPALSFFCGA
jgi:hypothetical protein